MITFKKILLVALVSLLLFAGLGTVITVFYADKVEAMIIKELNKKLNRPVLHKDISFSFLSKFPKSSVKIEQIYVQGIGKDDKAFIEAENLFLSFNLVSLIKNEMVINEITIEDATINIEVDKKGKVNYLIFEESKDTTSEGILNIEEVNLVKTKLIYTDLQNQVKIKAHSFNSLVHINIGQEKIIHCDWDGVVNRVKTSPYNVENIPLKGNIDVNITDSLVAYSFTKGKVISLPLMLSGNYDLIKKTNKVDFKLNKGELKQLVLLLDSKTQKEFLKYKLAGKITASGNVESIASNKTSVKGKFQFFKASMQLTDQFRLKEINLSSKLTWKNIKRLNTANLFISDFSINTGESELRGSGNIRGLKKLSAILHLEGIVDIPYIVDNLSETQLEVSSGKVIFNTDIEGDLGPLLTTSSAHFRNFKSEGKIDVENLSFISKEITDRFSKINGKIHFDNEKILLQQFTGNVNSSAFTLNGYLFDYLNKNEALSIDAKLATDQIILEEFIRNDAYSNADTTYKFNLPKRLNLRLEVAVGEFQFRKFTAKDIKGRVVLADQVLSFNPVFFNACQGDMSLKGRVITKSNGDLKYQGRMELNGINIKSAFHQMENFGQDFLVEKHLRGTLNSSIQLRTESDDELNMNLDKLFVNADIGITKGELIEFEPLIELEHYLQEEFKIDLALTNMKFKTLKNRIKIANRSIHIPEMDIASSGINLKISGDHSFDHDINYLFKIKNKEIFKAHKQNSIDAKYGVVENSDKTSTLPLLMTGTVDNPKFSYDLKAKKQIVKDNWVQEGKDIKKVIKKEINEILGKKDSTSKKENTTKIKVIWDDEE